MMTVEMMKGMKAKKIYYDKSDVAKPEVCSRDGSDEAMHVEMSGL